MVYMCGFCLMNADKMRITGQVKTVRAHLRMMIIAIFSCTVKPKNHSPLHTSQRTEAGTSLLKVVAKTWVIMCDFMVFCISMYICV